MTRFGPGPVFVYEAIAAARRRSTYVVRALAVLMLFAALGACGLVFWLQVVENGGPDQVGLVRQLSQLGMSFYIGIATVQVALALVAAPAATAGSVCLDRARGGLTAMLVTDLSDLEIVLGKLCGRLLPVVSMIFASLPVLAVAALLGGIIPESLVALVAITIALTVLGCALALALSVRMSRPHEVLTIVYTVFTVWALFPALCEMFATTGRARIPEWIYKFNPFVLAWGMYVWPGYLDAGDIAIFVAVMLGLSALLVADAVWRLRKFEGRARARRPRLAALGRLRKAVEARWPGPGLDPNPVLWREWHRARPSIVLRLIWGGYFAFVLVGTCLGASRCLGGDLRAGTSLIEGVNGFQVLLAFLILSATAPTALSEERERGSLDVLLCTPMTTRSIVLAKWWGAFRLVPWLALLPGVAATVVAATAVEVPQRILVVGPVGGVMTPIQSSPISHWDRLFAGALPFLSVLVQGALIVSVGLALATWIRRPGRAMAASVALYVLASVGILIVAEIGLVDLLVMAVLRLTGWAGAATRIERLGLSEGILALTPTGGQTFPLVLLSSTSRFARSDMWRLLSGALVVQAVVAAAALGFTLATFDRRLGRTGVGPRRPGKARRTPGGAPLPPPHRPRPLGGPAGPVGHPSEVGSSR